MQDSNPTRRSAIKALALLGVGATASAGEAAAHVGSPQHEGRSDAPIYVAPLTPQEDVEQNVFGAAVLQERQDGLKFVLNVVNIRNAMMAHIHEDEVLGPIAVWLYEFETQEDRLQEGQFSGLLDVGTITDDVIQQGRVDEAESESVDDLLRKIDAGEAYVNVHTEQYPSGVIAGRLRRVHPHAMMDGTGDSDYGSFGEYPVAPNRIPKRRTPGG